MLPPMMPAQSSFAFDLSVLKDCVESIDGEPWNAAVLPLNWPAGMTAPASVPLAPHWSTPLMRPAVPLLVRPDNANHAPWTFTTCVDQAAYMPTARSA